MSFLLEASIGNQILISCLLCRFDEGPHDMEGTLASLFTAPHHTCIFYAHSLREEHSVSRITGHCKNLVAIYLRGGGTGTLFNP